MGVQRHLKASFIFARKFMRDNTTRYLQYLPRTLNYAVNVSGRYPELQDFHHFMREQLAMLPAINPALKNEEILLCAE